MCYGVGARGDEGGVALEWKLPEKGHFALLCPTHCHADTRGAWELDVTVQCRASTRVNGTVTQGL